MVLPITTGLPAPGYSADTADLLALCRDCLEGKLSSLQDRFYSMSPEQRLSAVNAKLPQYPYPKYVGFTPLIAVLNSKAFAQALETLNEEALERFSGIVILLVEAGAGLTAKCPEHMDSLFHFVAHWAAKPRQTKMLFLLRSLKELILGNNGAAPRSFSAQERLSILSHQCRSSNMTALEYVLTSLTSTEVAGILMEMEQGLEVHNYNSLLQIALQRLTSVCKRHNSGNPVSYFDVNPSLMDSLLRYVHLCILHGALPGPFLKSFVYTNREAVLSYIRPHQQARANIAPSEAHALLQEHCKSLETTLTLLCKEAPDQAAADQKAAELMMALKKSRTIIWTLPSLRYSADAATLPPFQRALVAGDLQGITDMFDVLTAEQKAAAANMSPTGPHHLGLTSLLAILTSNEFAKARYLRDSATLERFGKILTLLIQAGADIKTQSPLQEDSLLYFLVIWASIPGQDQMLVLLRSLRDQLLGRGPDAGRVFTAADRLEILCKRQRFEGRDLTPFEFVFLHRRSPEVAEILLEIAAGLLGPADLDALQKIALDKLKDLCNIYRNFLFESVEENDEFSLEESEFLTAYFDLDPEWVGCLLEYIRLCIAHGASPQPLLDSFVCKNREGLMNFIKPYEFDRSEEQIAECPDFQLYATKHYVQIEFLKNTLAAVYAQADKALADLQAAEASSQPLLLLAVEASSQPPLG